MEWEEGFMDLGEVDARNLLATRTSVHETTTSCSAFTTSDAAFKCWDKIPTANTWNASDVSGSLGTLDKELITHIRKIMITTPVPTSASGALMGPSASSMVKGANASATKWDLISSWNYMNWASRISAQWTLNYNAATTTTTTTSTSTSSTTSTTPAFILKTESKTETQTTPTWESFLKVWANESWTG